MKNTVSVFIRTLQIDFDSYEDFVFESAQESRLSPNDRPVATRQALSPRDRACRQATKSVLRRQSGVLFLIKFYLFPDCFLINRVLNLRFYSSTINQFSSSIFISLSLKLEAFSLYSFSKPSLLQNSSYISTRHTQPSSKLPSPQTCKV